MARFKQDKNGKTIEVEPHTKPHSRPKARNAQGKPYFPSSEVAAQEPVKDKGKGSNA